MPLTLLLNFYIWTDELEYLTLNKKVDHFSYR